MTALHHGNVLQFHSWYVLYAAEKMYRALIPTYAYLLGAQCMYGQVIIGKMHMRPGVKPEITSGWYWSTALGAIL